MLRRKLAGCGEASCRVTVSRATVRDRRRPHLRAGCHSAPGDGECRTGSGDSCRSGESSTGTGGKRVAGGSRIVGSVRGAGIDEPLGEFFALLASPGGAPPRQVGLRLDHLPVGARLCGTGASALHGKDLYVVSWNVLNHHFLEHIEKDLQGLRGSSIHRASKMSMKRVRQIVDAVKTMLDRTSEMPKAIVCLQACWPELLAVLEWELRDLRFAVRRTGRELSQKNQEASGEPRSR